ncbi:hypothetical protein ACQJBY_067845 [Aegilops geniculata]
MQSSSSPSKQPPNQSSAPPEGSRGGAGGSRVHGPGRETGLASAAPSTSTGPALDAGSGAPEEPRPRSRRPSLGALLQARVSIDLGIQSPPLDIDGDEDRISALPDEVLLGILERLDMREAVRAGAFSSRWRQLPHRLSRLSLDIFHFGVDISRADLGGRCSEAMQAYIRALYRSLSPCPPPADCKRAIKTLILRFLPLALTDLTSIGHAVEDVVNRGETESLEFHICSPDGYGRERIMSFLSACSVAFRSLSKLTLNNLWLAHSDVNTH